MSSSAYDNEPVVNPLAPVEQLLRWLMTTTIHLAIGLAIGLLAARVMRSRHLRWTWAAGALVLVVLAREILGGGTLTLGTAALSATVRGRRWHREDMEAGADLADVAAGRHGPLDALRSLARKVEARWSAPGSESWWRGDRLTVGHERDGRAVTIPLGGGTGGTHTLVVGATRSGKTVTMTWMTARAIERAVGTIVLDPKGDRDLRRELHDVAKLAGRPFVEWTPRGPSVYNPYARGSETEIADKVLAGERFTEPHYLRQAQRYLGHEVRVLRKAGLEVSLRALVHHLDPSRLEVLARSLPASEAQGAHDYLDSLTTRQQSDLAGVRDRLAIMAESDIGGLLDPRTPDMVRLDLLDAAKAGAVVYFNLEADRRPLLAQMLGAAIVQDLQAMVAALQQRPVPTLVMIDEFSAIVPERVVGLFARAGGAGVSLVLGTQELADLRVPGREALLEQIMGNLSVLIAHRQVVPASAELIAGVTGARGVWRTSQHGDGKLTRTRGFESALRAEQIMSLPQAWAAVVGLADGGSVSIARILSPQRCR
ncbi:MAG TPA: TraM recognition domain-containing protein [Solirubrobacteraceae bacterium]|nr:TraM recognition domain-containing protein [Solirubrobacteraceae bacterium]